MSSSRDHRELTELIGDLCNGTLDEPRRARLQQLLLEDAPTRGIYRRYIHLHASLRQYQVAYGPRGVPAKGRAPILGFLGDAFQAGADILGRSLVLSLLFAIALPCIILAVLLVHIGSQPTLELAVEPKVSRPVAAAAPVAQVTQTRQCEWEKDSARASVGDFLLPGRRLRLSAGLVEVTFSDGARVLLEGPALFDAKSVKEGFLRSGNLVARVPKGAGGFTVETPMATVVDLGTEFGVSVEDEGRAADVQVFQGEVELTSAAAKDKQAVRRRLEAGRAVRVELVGQTKTTVFREIVPVADRFVRHLPRPSAEPAVIDATPKPGRVILADFSGGNGKSEVDQLPGVPGPGWATAWMDPEAITARPMEKTEGVEVIASVENSHPILDGGNYLRCSAKRLFGAERVVNAVVRRFESVGNLVLSKPHVISFDLRIDEFSRFDTSYDSVTVYGDQNLNTSTSPTTGWAIRASGHAVRGIPAGHWIFYNRHEPGKYREIDSGIAIRQGGVYSFRIVVNPEQRSWTPSIAVDGGEPKRFQRMAMRSIGTAAQCKYWSFLCFHEQMKGGNRGEALEKLVFSVDSIRIAPFNDNEEASSTADADGSRGEKTRKGLP